MILNFNTKYMFYFNMISCKHCTLLCFSCWRSTLIYWILGLFVILVKELFTYCGSVSTEMSCVEHIISHKDGNTGALLFLYFHSSMEWQFVITEEESGDSPTTIYNNRFWLHQRIELKTLCTAVKLNIPAPLRQ